MQPAIRHNPAWTAIVPAAGLLALAVSAAMPGLVLVQALLVAALPVTSLLVLGWLYVETRDAQRVAGMSMDIFWFVLGGLLFFPALSLSIKAGWQPWLCFALAGLAGFAGMSGVQYLLTHFRTTA